MTTRTIHYNAIKGCFEMRDDKDWNRRDDYILDVVLRDESATDSGENALRESMQIQSRKAYMKRDRREALINRALAFALALVVIGLVLIVLGVLR